MVTCDNGRDTLDSVHLRQNHVLSDGIVIMFADRCMLHVTSGLIGLEIMRA